MSKKYSDIGPVEKKVLQDQYESSPFFINNRCVSKPTKLEIFDFDSTLFLSPSLSPSIWHSSLIQQLVGEDVFGPGWWKDYRSLDLGPIDTLEKTQWKNYWNEDIVDKARKSIDDPTVMTVLLTGRRAIPFYPLVSRILASKQLHFDLLGLRPDPTKETHDDYVNSSSNNNNNDSDNDTSYGASSVFINTLDFKTCFVLNILHNVPSINTITMWDDRAPHVKKFQQFLDSLTSQGLIAHGLAKHVIPVRPYYRPKWERRVVSHVLESHNANELLYREKQRWNRNINKITWESHHLLEDEENNNDNNAHHHHSHSLTKIAKHLSLAYIPSATVVRLDQSSVNKLRDAFEPFYSTQLKRNNQELTGWRAKAEIPLWFGHQVILFQNVHDDRRLESYGGLGMKVKFTVRSISQPDPQLGMVALVDIHPDIGTDYQHHTDNNWPSGLNGTKKYILPLMYRPSQANTISRKTFQWIRVPNRHHLHQGFGEISHSHLLGLDGTVKDKGEHQLICLDPETKSTVLGKRTSIDLISLDDTVKDNGEHQSVCLDLETKSTTLRKCPSIDLIDLS